MTRRGWLLFAAMAVIWGIPYLLIKIAVGELTPVTLVFLRTAVGATLLLPIAAARGGLRPLLPYWRWVLAYTVVEVSLPWWQDVAEIVAFLLDRERAGFITGANFIADGGMTRKMIYEE